MKAKQNRDFALFQKEFKKWQYRFGLTGYKVFFKYEPIGDGFADIQTNLSNMSTTVRLNSKLNNENKPFKDVKRSAKHEASHLLIGRLELNGRARYMSDAEIYETTEELVNKLVDLV